MKTSRCERAVLVSARQLLAPAAPAEGYGCEGR